MTRRWVILGLAFVVVCAVIAITLTITHKSEPECDSCTARHKDKVRLHEFLKTKKSEAE